MATENIYTGGAKNAWAGGLTVFGGVGLATVGGFQLLMGLSAVLKDTVYVHTDKYVYKLDLVGWGWIHLILGVVAIVVGLTILVGAKWALTAGIVIAVLSALSNFAFIPQAPWWALLIIAIDIVLIWSFSVVLRWP
ncbi:MAG TPA: hypothetical protein VGN19_08580 [Pedococcus sp.]|jgi:hypothetical protein|nr:hypothetical protein [Pedococcus sp.]